MNTWDIADSNTGVVRSICAGTDGCTPPVLPAPWVSIPCDSGVMSASIYLRLSDQTLQPRTALPSFNKVSVTANGIDAAVISSGLPNPTHVVIAGDSSDSFDVTDGILSLSFSAPGNYIVSLDSGAAYVAPTTLITAT